MTAVGLGLDVGGTKIAGGLVDAGGRVHTARRVATPPGAAERLDAIATMGDELRVAASDEGLDLVGAGVGTAGVVAPATGAVVYASENLPGWTGTPLRSLLQQRLGLPVVVANDVAMMASGDLLAAPEQAGGRSLHVAVGTGLGGALADDGNVDHGRRGMVGEFGHLVVAPDSQVACGCGRHGHLEPLVSGPGIVAAHNLEAARPVDDLRALAALVEHGDDLATSMVRRAATLLGRVLGGLVTALDVDRVRVAGGVVALGPVWWEPLEAALRAEAILGDGHALEVELLDAGPDAVVLGAGMVALQQGGPR